MFKMNYLTKVMLIFWSMEQISRPYSKEIVKLRTIEKKKLTFMSEISSMLVFERDMSPQLMFVTEGEVYVTNAREYPESHFALFSDFLGKKTIPALAPGGAFGFPAVTISSTEKIIIIDVSDSPKTRYYPLITGTAFGSGFNFYNPVWLDNNRFIVGYSSATSGRVLKVTGVEGNETKDWSVEIFDLISLPAVFDMAYHDNVHGDKDIIFAATLHESSAGIALIGNLRGSIRAEDMSQVRSSSEKFPGMRHHQMVDMNNDGRLDALISYEDDKGNIIVKVFEIPDRFVSTMSIVSSWEERASVTFKKSKDTKSPCINKLTTFKPTTSYEGRPWILIGEENCCSASYLEPENGWNYKRVEFFKGNEVVTATAATNIDSDDYTELFIAMNKTVRVYSFEIVPKSHTAPGPGFPVVLTLSAITAALLLGKS